MVLGQLYTVKHQPDKAEAEFKTAQAIEPESEEVVLNLARLYAESGDLQHAVKAIEAVPEDGRTPKMEFTLGALYDQLKQPKDAIAAYQRADGSGARRPADHGRAGLRPCSATTSSTKRSSSTRHLPRPIPRTLRRWFISVRSSAAKASMKMPWPPSARRARSIRTHWKRASTKGCCSTYWAASTTPSRPIRRWSDATSHANGAYTDDERNNRGIFLERLGAVYLEENKTDQAVAAYQKMIDMGGSSAVRGYQGEVDAYRDAHQFDKAIDVSRKAVAANPKDRDLKLMLAGELADQDHPDEGLAHG